MIELKQTETFRKWYTKLKDERATTAISLRLARLAYGHLGDAEPIGKGVSELRIHYGPGYRVYFQRRDAVIVILLCGGDKRSQTRDIKTALRLAAEWSE
ncbi:type II toxin-antitoxin system RelE/ParE family toxin [Candidatus Williamhamiltonella defendens]|uniref:Addiction module antitoxin RelB n=1 Tax=Candidatus Hamiltonella defensa (Bemisia tabaci) TaxID=672795 RepID=A0A249DWF7_9ENTR|nr:type II toxin-antitoxin system RelE/ParE family toxin [Candidatus Hamiltonella defensa]ASX25878.1 addiction module antitoxin RelB [Candidatus Hamiltonella defensa (Bemisia tabaci)]CED78662.1 Putative addiction module [Candidatus Hamiltonella defensa (Bemisia tabaci)]